MSLGMSFLNNYNGRSYRRKIPNAFDTINKKAAALRLVRASSISTLLKSWYQRTCSSSSASCVINQYWVGTLLKSWYRGTCSSSFASRVIDRYPVVKSAKNRSLMKICFGLISCGYRVKNERKKSALIKN